MHFVLERLSKTSLVEKRVDKAVLSPCPGPERTSGKLHCAPLQHPIFAGIAVGDSRENRSEWGDDFGSLPLVSPIRDKPDGRIPLQNGSANTDRLTREGCLNHQSESSVRGERLSIILTVTLLSGSYRGDEST